MVDLAVNPDLADGVILVDSPVEGEQPRPALPDGLYYADQPLPEDRVELFRANGHIYTLPKHVKPKIAFRQMRRLRQGMSEERAMSEALYDLLGDAVMDFLCDEDLSDEQMDQVTDAVQKYMMGSAKLAGLGKSGNGPSR